MAKVKISELREVALDWACVHVAGATHMQLAVMSDEKAIAIVAAHTEGDTVDIPDELVEGKS